MQLAAGLTRIARCDLLRIAIALPDCKLARAVGKQDFLWESRSSVQMHFLPDHNPLWNRNMFANCRSKAVLLDNKRYSLLVESKPQRNKHMRLQRYNIHAHRD